MVDRRRGGRRVPPVPSSQDPFPDPGLVDQLLLARREVSSAELRRVVTVVRIVKDVLAKVRRTRSADPPEQASRFADSDELSEAFRRSADHIAVALTCSSAQARALAMHSWRVVEVVPEMAQALRDDHLDPMRMNMLSRRLADLEDSDARDVVLALRGPLPDASACDDSGIPADLPRSPSRLDVTWETLRRRTAQLERERDDARREAFEATAGPEPANSPAPSERTFIDHGDDGTSTIGAVLDPARAMEAYANIDAQAKTVAKQQGIPISEARAKVVFWLLSGRGPVDARAARSGTKRITLTVPWRSVLDPACHVPGEITGPGGTTFVPADVLARAVGDMLAGGATWNFAATSPDGTVLAATAPSYRIPDMLKDLVRTRDRTCGFPGCTRSAPACDTDHVVPWPQGATVADNLVVLCRHHHRLKTHHGWSYVCHPDGSTTWTSPTGHKTHHPRRSIPHTRS